jgi:opacity protein-like surface antigen
MPGSVSIFPGKKVSVGDRSYENEKEKSKSKSKADEFSFKEECYDERPKIEKIADTKPMLVVHGYYDTGKKIKINGVLRPILRPMTSFGYFINHEGDLEGWKNSLKGAGLINPVPNAPNWYKIAVSNNGTAKITTTIKTIERKFAISARLGRNFPHGDFNTIIDQGLSLNVGLEYMMNRNLSVEAVFGYHTFAEGDFVDSVDILQFSINGRYFYPFMGRVRAFINSGVGFYKIDPGDTEFGFNVGTGFDFYISNQFSLEAAYNYHNIKVGDGYYRFSTAQGGFRFRF